MQVVGSLGSHMAPVLSARPSSSCLSRNVSFEMENDDTRLTAISNGRTSYLPLIGLPKKKVDFDPKKSIIQPFAVHDIDESWGNLKAEITRRKSLSCAKEKAADVRLNSPNSAAHQQQAGTMARIQRRFKKVLVRLRQVFMSDAAGCTDEAKEIKDSTRPASRILVRRDSNVNSSKRLAAKRRRMNLSELEALVDSERNKEVEQVNENGEDTDTGQITSELADIFEHLSVSLRKRPRLTINSFDLPEDEDVVMPS